MRRNKFDKMFLMKKETEKYVIEELKKVDATLNSVDKGLHKIDEKIEKIKVEHDEFNLQMSYFQKRDIGRPFGMDFHDCEMTYQ